MDECRYEELEHTAEVGVRVDAPGADALYACAARAMFGLLQAAPDREGDAVVQRIVMESMDAESLMVDWLGELLYLHETTGMMLAACVVTAWSPVRVDADVTFAPPVEPPTMHIKAVTYHQLSVVETEAGWRADVYFDI